MFNSYSGDDDIAGPGTTLGELLSRLDPAPEFHWIHSF